jgi:hypothetical protein
MDALIKGLEAAAYPIRIDAGEENKTLCDVDGIPVRFCLKEEVERKVIPPPPSKSKSAVIYPWDVPRPKIEFHPTGKLRLCILETVSVRARHSWADGTRKPLEGHLNAFVTGLLVMAQAKQADRAARERREEERREWQRLENERVIEAGREQARVQELEQEFGAWSRARQVRDYLAGVKAAAEHQGAGIDPASRLAAWLRWGEAYADGIDPLSAPHELPGPQRGWSQPVHLDGWGPEG